MFACIRGPSTCSRSLIETITADFAQSDIAVVHPTIGVIMRLVKSSTTTIAEQFVSAGCAGATVRFSPTPIADRKTLEPLQQAFEPLRLFPPDREGLARFVKPSTQLEQLAEFLQRRPGDAKAARLARFAQLAMILFGLMVLAAAFLAAVFGIISSRSSHLLPLLDYGPLFLGLFALAVSPRPLQVFVAPQSLIVRESARFARTWEIKLYVRSRSTLIYWPDTSVLAVADDSGRSDYCLCAPQFADAALRAWLCPQPPPHETQLDDFRGA
ncbi:MAG: hypothetical protein JNG88_07185 [Phycisphaerales bacterium]|nr:hypothetical protein [Phycisphaerales bacterium]